MTANGTAVAVCYFIDEWMLLEYACCFMPVNQESLVQAVTKETLDVPADLAKAMGLDGALFSQPPLHGPRPSVRERCEGGAVHAADGGGEGGDGDDRRRRFRGDDTQGGGGVVRAVTGKSVTT